MRTLSAQLSRWSLPKRARRHRRADPVEVKRTGRVQSFEVSDVNDAPVEPGLFQSARGVAPGPRSGWRLAGTAAIAVHALVLGVALAVPPPEPKVEERPEEPEVVFLQFSPAAASAPPAVEVAAPKPIARRVARPKPVAEVVIPPKTPVVAPKPPEVAEAPVQPEAPVEPESSAQPESGVVAAGATAGGTGAGGTAKGEGIVAGGTGVGLLGDAAVPARQLAHPPRPLRRVEAAYPRLAERSRIQGRVIVRLIIGVDGRVEQDSVQILRSVSELDEAAIAAARQWRFTPGRTAAGKLVRVIVDLPFQFSLQ